MALSFARDIRPMFRDTDVATMQDYGMDLSSYADVKNKVQAIYATLAEGTMPCDGAWPKDRVATLKRWMDEGMEPYSPRSGLQSVGRTMRSGCDNSTTTKRLTDMV